MTMTLFLLLPEAPVRSDAPDDAAHDSVAWWLTDDDALVMAGDDDGWRAHVGTAPFVALVPAEACPLTLASYPGLTPVQAVAAAETAARDAALGDPASLHAVAGPIGGDEFATAVVTHDQMRGWTSWCADRALEPQAMVPAALLVPPAEPDQPVRAVLAGRAMLRTATHVFSADGLWAEGLTGGAAVRHADRVEIEPMLRALALSPPINLLSGAWRTARRWGIAPADQRLIARLTLALALVTIAIPVAQLVRLHHAENQADAAALAQARAAGVPGSSAAAAENEIDRRLAARGGPLALSIPAAAVLAAMRDVPGVRAERMAHSADGTLSLTLAAPRIEGVNAVLIALQNQGYRVTAQPLSAADGLQKGMITVRAVP